jgi:hypothetical protein
MSKIHTCFLVCGFLLLLSCEKDKPPVEVNVVYTVEYQGRTTQVSFVGELGDEVSGYCAFGDSGDATYPKTMTLRLVRNTGAEDNHELQLKSVRMRETAAEEALPCESVHINYNAVEENGTLLCGDAASGRCEIVVRVFDKKEERIEGILNCGEFPTTSIDPSGPVPMEIRNGQFSITHCN